MFKQLFTKNPYKCYLSTQQKLWCETFSIKFHSKTSSERKQLGGYEYEEDTSGFKNILAVTNTHLEIKETTSNKRLEVNFEWLRENCRCASCYNGVTNQRNICIFDLKTDIQPTTFSLFHNTLKIGWNDGHHSEYDLDWLRVQNRAEDIPAEILWSGDMSAHVEYVTASDVKSKEGITRLIKSLLDYGVGFVTNVKHNIQSTEEIIRCIGPPQKTLFGTMWEFTNKMEHLDSAYSNIALDAHTDTSYFIEPAGLIIFHCMERNCEGGKTLLVDGFRAAKEVELESPDLYHCLRTVPTEFQYIEKGYHLTSLSTMIQHSLHGRINQIRYNLYDRSARQPLQSVLFYRSLRKLAAAVRKPKAEWWLTLEPGTVVFINNWRVLHGRSAFYGQRTMGGAYLHMGNFLSRARSLALIT
ncbi:trimethyllysine dioxygenase, mitochondrial-like isoform X1 [Homalodisca vitripennis]|uniref:trimethyllysine dioxygenase, mitochondrial-like isoform X1 n=1 Tax=Homalodisca vitripennis TaxID=197043 RepID=UPI001EEC83EF|nr:trimethyllysine dioxygenase, mitochondrial-like isoform X1 [Homalodisca vitripennis]